MQCFQVQLHKKKELSNLKKSFPWRSVPYAKGCAVFSSDQSILYAEKCELRASDIVVLTFPKTGTTWLQQVCESLRSRGDMNFSEICEVQPWLEAAWDCGQDLDVDQRAFPRVFKSHNRLSGVNPGAKYLTIVRDPEKVLNSWFSFQHAKGFGQAKRFLEAKYGFHFIPDNVDEYVKTGHFDSDAIFGTNVWDYYIELWKARRLPNVLLMSYEEILRNPRMHIHRIADFIGVRCDEELLNIVERTSSLEFMKEHDSQFDENFTHRKHKELGRSRFIVTPASKVGLSRKSVINEVTKQWLQQMWFEKVESATGLKSYAEMESMIAKLN